MSELIFTDLSDIAPKTPFSKDQLDDFVHRLVRENDPLRVYLHGSFVWGEPNSNSDIDFCVLLPDNRGADGEHDFADVDEYEIDIDVDVYYPSLEKFEEMLSSPATLEHRLYHEGILLYTKPDLVFDHSRPMYRLDEEFIRKANANLKASRRLLPDGSDMYGIVLFNVHQTYEMALRAFRAFHLHKIHKDHNIRLLRAFCCKIDTDFLNLDRFKPNDARRITRYYLARYKREDELPSIEKIREQIELAEKMLRFVEQKLASTPRPTEPTPLGELDESKV